MDKLLRLRVVLRETNIGEFYDYAYGVSDPKGPEYGHYLKRDSRSDAQVDLEYRYKKIAAVFREADVVPVRDSQAGSPYSPLLFIDGDLDYFSRFIERKSLTRFLSDSSGGTQLNPWEWERPLAELEHEIRSIHVARCGTPEPESTRKPRSMRGLAAPVRGVFVSDPSTGTGPKSSDFRLSMQAPRFEDGMTPQMIREHYNFPKEYDCKGQTIAIMSIGASTLRDALRSDLSKFWQADGKDQPELEFVPVGPQSSDVATSPLNRLEASMGPAWIGALAPGAKIIVYEVALSLPDPWLAVVEMAVSDPRAPNVLCMTWTQSEDMYYRQFNRGSIALALAKAAAYGITVIAASGDWGVYDGRPAAVLESDPSGKVARAAWPHATFPSSEEFVLSVGGTLVSSLNPPTEIGWSGPLPPDPALEKELPFLSLASSGGFSERVPVPDWQRDVVVGADKQRSYSRGTNLPAVLPYGRGYPDVALMASGPALAVGEDGSVSAMGYRLFVDGNWIGYAGGTSMAAPIWAAIIAVANARRNEQGLAPLGFINPLLYYVAQVLPGGKQGPLRDISSGNSDIAFRVVSAQGRADQHTLAGYCAKPQWDPITGLGVPNVVKLSEALLNYPANFRAKSA